MYLRRMSENGINEFEQYLNTLTTDSPGQFPDYLITDRAYSRPVIPEVEISNRDFASRYELAEYLFEKLKGILDVEIDKPLWTWLAAFYFRRLCREDDTGRRRPGTRARWIPEIKDFRKYYRHLLAGPYRIYKTFRDAPETALALLCTPVDRPGDIVEQLSSRQELVTNLSVMQIATRLYVDPDTRLPKRGASGKGPGSARRLADVLNQFDLTYDLYSMTPDQILDLLPEEFDVFMS